MASGDDLKASFEKFATKGTPGKKEMTSKDATRWFKDCGVFGKTCSSNSLDIAFSAVKGKGAFTCDKCDALIDKLAKDYAKDHKCSEDDAKTQMKAKLAGGEKKTHGTTGVSKTGNVGKMTDTSQYTGAHKERFGADGKGKGIEGRADIADNSGYVGNYKGEGSYDQKKK
jgi:hypothetical protein